MHALGVDGAGKHGWAGVAIDDDGFTVGHVALTLAELVAGVESRLGASLEAIGVDIPIGLLDARNRSADRAAKAYVGVRRSSVFWAPHRSALTFDDFAAANEHLASIGMPKVSKQAMALFPRIREVAELAADPRIVEVFPEATFRRLAGEDIGWYKKTWAGTAQRLHLLEAAMPSIVIPWDVAGLSPLAVDDVIDAGAAAWSALRHARGEAEALGDPAEVDPRTGRRIAMWV